MNTTLRDELVTLTTELIRFRTTADRPDQLAAAIDYVEHYLADTPGLFIHRSESNGKPALVATLHDTRTPSLFLNGHIDVVMAKPEQFEPQVRNGRIYGRASQDMKGSVAVLLRLLKDLAARDPRPNVGFQFVGDEEIGGAHGTERLLNEGWRCDCFVALEPTDMRICNEHKGAMWIDLRLRGIPVHGSRPWEGQNPVLALNAGLNRLNRCYPALERAEWRTTVTPTVVQTGDSSPNQIPPHLLLTLDIRHIPGETPAAVLSAVQDCFPGAEVLVCRDAAPLATSPDVPSIRRLAEVNARVRNRPTEFYHEHFSTDARFYSAVGIPAVCFGPVGAGLHSDEEWVEIDSLVQLYEVFWEYTTV